MGYVHISKSKGRTIEDFRAVSAKHNAPADIDGLLAWAAGSDENGLHVVTVWQSRAHQERWAAEQLSPRSRSSAWLRTCWPTRSSPSTRPASCTSAEPMAEDPRSGWGSSAIMLGWQRGLGPSWRLARWC